jgi:hypothetical protein
LRTVCPDDSVKRSQKMLPNTFLSKCTCIRVPFYVKK